MKKPWEIIREQLQAASHYDSRVGAVLDETKGTIAQRILKAFNDEGIFLREIEDDLHGRIECIHPENYYNLGSGTCMNCGEKV